MWPRHCFSTAAEAYKSTNGQILIIYECLWCDDIQEGTALADIVSEQEVLAAARQAGFEILENRDRALEPTGVPWHKSISKDISLFGLTMHWGYLRSVLTLTTLFIMETLRLAPRGSVKVYRMLGTGARGLAAGGRKGIFTPMYLLVLRKPSN